MLSYKLPAHRTCILFLLMKEFLKAKRRPPGMNNSLKKKHVKRTHNCDRLKCDQATFLIVRDSMQVKVWQGMIQKKWKCSPKIIELPIKTRTTCDKGVVHCFQRKRVIQALRVKKYQVRWYYEFLSRRTWFIKTFWTDTVKTTIKHFIVNAPRVKGKNRGFLAIWNDD